MSYTCSRCGQAARQVIISDGKVFCAQCASTFGTCEMCKKARKCEFVSSPDPMPKTIVRTVQKGQFTAQTEVMNPERVKKFCESCDCYDKENGCLKENGTCSNYDEKVF